MSETKADATSNAVEGVETAQHIKVLDLVPKHDCAWYRVPHLLWLNLKMTVPMMTGFLIGFDSSMLNGIQAVPKWIEGKLWLKQFVLMCDESRSLILCVVDFNDPRGSYLGMLVTMQTIGAIVSLPFAPILTDRLGRKHPVAIGSVICLMGTALQSAAPNAPMFVAGRFFIGFGSGLVGNASGPLIAELAYPSHRPFLSAFAGTTWVCRLDMRTNISTDQSTVPGCHCGGLVNIWYIRHAN